MRAIILDIDGTLIQSMSVDTDLYFSSIREVIGPVMVRDKLDDYDHVTDSGILAQLLEDNGYSRGDEVTAAIQAIFVEGLRRHIESMGSFQPSTAQCSLSNVFVIPEAGVSPSQRAAGEGRPS